MGRKAHFDKEHFVRAAMEILAKGTPNDVTMQAVAERAGGPIGSLYHRFASRDHLMAELWITLVDQFQAGFLERLSEGDVQGRGASYAAMGEASFCGSPGAIASPAGRPHQRRLAG